MFGYKNDDYTPLPSNEYYLLSKEHVLSFHRLEVLKKVGLLSNMTDFAITLGGCVSNSQHIKGDNSLKGRTGYYLLTTQNNKGNILGITSEGRCETLYSDTRIYGIRPIVNYLDVEKYITGIEETNKNVLEVSMGEYPQYAADIETSEILDSKLSDQSIIHTGNAYTTDSKKYINFNDKIHPIKHTEYEYNGEKYIRVKSLYFKEKEQLSNGRIISPKDYAWIKVSPIIWYYDEKSNLLISKSILASGLRFTERDLYTGDFNNTDAYIYLNDFFAKEINQNQGPVLKKKQ